jgi:hypothetical protein
VPQGIGSTQVDGGPSLQGLAPPPASESGHLPRPSATGIRGPSEPSDRWNLRLQLPDGMRMASVAAVRTSWVIRPKGRYKWRMLPTFLLTSVGELGTISLTSHAALEAIQRY